jgi:hypothetical protein
MATLLSRGIAFGFLAIITWKIPPPPSHGRHYISTSLGSSNGIESSPFICFILKSSPLFLFLLQRNEGRERNNHFVRFLSFFFFFQKIQNIQLKKEKENKKTV